MGLRTNATVVLVLVAVFANGDTAAAQSLRPSAESPRSSCTLDKPCDVSVYFDFTSQAIKEFETKSSLRASADCLKSQAADGSKTVSLGR